MSRHKITEATTKRTDWIACKDGPWHPELPHGGTVAYRIWSQTDGRQFWQRHEWKRADGSIQMDDWICGGSKHVANGHAVAA
jgi:hypothetical protein